MQIEVVSMNEDHLDDIAALFDRRYKVLQRMFPYLPDRLKKADSLTGKLGNLIQKGPGAVALQGGQIVGYLTGMVLHEFQGKRSIYSPEWANGADLENSRMIYQEMYHRLAGEWVSDGCLTHVLTLLGGDSQGLNAWHWMGFGLVAVDGIRRTEALNGVNPDIELRQAGLEDVEHLTPLLEGLAGHLAAAPTFWIHDAENPTVLLAQPGNFFWLAVKDQQVVACMGLKAGCLGGVEFFDNEQAISIEPAFTREEERKQGIATALLSRCLQWAGEQGYPYCGVDFETANVLAARFWLRWFSPFCYSLMRSIDERAANGLR